jgi:hypothetical protein
MFSSSVHEVLPVDVREALRDHDLEAEIAGGVGRVLTTRALPVISAGDDRVSLFAIPAFPPSAYGA